MRSDVIVIGAGLNGLAAALALGGRTNRRPAQVILVDRFDPREPRGQSRDSRGTAMTPATVAMLKSLGVWDDLKDHVAPMTRITVTDGPVGGGKPLPVLLGFDIDEARSALIVENHRLMAALVRGVTDSPEIRLVAGCDVEQTGFAPGLAKVSLSTGDVLTAELVVGADGRQSPTRKAAGIDVWSRNYDQSAITLSISHSQPHDGCADEHFTPTGVLAVLPLPEARSSIVWATTPQEVSRLMELEDGAFRNALQAAIGEKRGSITETGPRHAYPLSVMVAKEIAATRCALVGDAAHVIHPLAGLGLNLGFKDAAALADCVHDAHLLGSDVGSAAVLERYQQWRRFEIMTTALAMDGFKTLFANENPFLKLVRDAGLLVTDKLPPLKAMFRHEASGLTGTLPRLMRGLG